MTPKNRDAWMDFAETLFEAGQLEEALEAYGRALQLKPDCAETYLSQARTHLALGNADESFRSLKMALGLDPSQKEQLSQTHPELYGDLKIRRMLGLDR